MSKDFAFLFYPGAWSSGTRLFTFAHKGAYMELLMAQHDNGHLSIDDIKHLLGHDYETMWESKLKAKFEIDASGLYYNDKLQRVMDERAEYKAGRMENLKGHKKRHMDIPHEKPMCKDKDISKDITIEVNVVVEAWNSLGEPFPKVIRLGNRATTLKARLGEPWWVENYRVALERIKASDFCRGINNNGWKISFEFFIQPDSVAKILEGKYDNRDKIKPSTNPSEIKGKYDQFK